MAVKIIASRSEGVRNGKNYLRAELIADSASELNVEGVNNYHFTFGSVAYCIAEKSFYVLNSSGTWVSSSEDSANTLSTTSLNRPSGLMSTKPISLSPDVTESDTGNSESITEDVPDINVGENIEQVDAPVELTKEHESEGTSEMMEEIPETETLESKEVTENAEPLRNTESE